MKVIPETCHARLSLISVNVNNIYLENNQKIQYIKHSKCRQDSETSISVFKCNDFVLVL